MLSSGTPQLRNGCAAPGTGGGFLMIAELQARSGGMKLG
jgi:hypothetical protein